MEEEQFKMETLTWLAISDFKEDLPYLPLSANPQAISYHYLYGQAWVLYSEKNDGKIALNIRLATNLNTIKEIFLEIIP
ncbi:MAG: hypothetical protein H0Z32_06600 [Bacillaceae bacterium]|nr:hypothetical protein [Bacillaceae bacterium]